MENIFICYDQGFQKLQKSVYPCTFRFLSKRNLSVKSDENLDGDLVNSRAIPTTVKGISGIRLTEVYFSPMEYETAIQEIGAGNNPVLFCEKRKFMIMLVKQPILN